MRDEMACDGLPFHGTGCPVSDVCRNYLINMAADRANRGMLKTTFEKGA